MSLLMEHEGDGGPFLPSDDEIGMSQAIPGFTPPPPSYPYQGNLQQQGSAALASSSSGMSGDSIALITIGAVTGCGLLTLGSILAVKHFSASTDKSKPDQATSLTSKPAKREEAAQIEFMPGLTEEILSRRPTPRPPPQSARQYITLPGFPGFIYLSDGVYREEGESCGKCAYSTVRRAFGMDPITEKKFKEIVPEVLYPGTLATNFVELAHRDGLDAMEHFPAQFGGAGIDNIKAFIILLNLPPPLKPHYVTLVRSEITGCFHLSDSVDQDKAKSEIYSGTATEAFLEYQKRHNFIAHSVISFHEHVPAHGMVPQRPSLSLR